MGISPTALHGSSWKCTRMNKRWKALILASFLLASIALGLLTVPYIYRHYFWEFRTIEFQSDRCRDFETVQELKAWLYQDDTDSSPYRPGFICGDFAVMLRDRALEDGFLLGIHVVEKPQGTHAVNCALIGHRLYFIEPQTDEVLGKWLITEEGGLAENL